MQQNRRTNDISDRTHLTVDRLNNCNRTDEQKHISGRTHLTVDRLNKGNRTDEQTTSVAEHI